MRKWLKWIGVVCLIPIVLVLLIAILIYIPPVQNWLVQKGTHYASEATGMQISLKRIHLSFPLDLTVKGVEVIAPPDTLVSLDALSIRVNPFHILDHRLSVDALTLEGVKLNTGLLIEGMIIEGDVGSLKASADYINLSEEKVTLNKAILSKANINLRIDSLSQDTTTSEPLKWVLALEKIGLKDVSFAMQMPMDSIWLSTHITEASLKDGVVDLGLSKYTVSSFMIDASKLNYDMNESAAAPGFDYTHIGLTDLKASVDSILYHGMDMEATISSFSVRERSGLEISSLKGDLISDSVQISVPSLTLETPASNIKLFANVPWEALETGNKKTMRALITASVGKDDIFTFVNDLPADFQETYPNKQLLLNTSVEGNMSALHIRQLKMELPEAFSLTANGKVSEVMDSVKRTADIDIEATTGDLNFVLNYLPAENRNGIHIPSGIHLNGNVKIQEQEYLAQLQMAEDDATIDIDGRFHPVHESYQAELKIDNLAPVRFLPNDSIMTVTASLKAEGKGFDPYSATTWITAEGELSHIQYVDISLSDVSLNANLKENNASINLNSADPNAQMNIIFDGKLTEELSEGMLIMDVDSINLEGLGLMEERFITSFQLFAEGKTNLKEYNNLDVSLGNWEVRTAQQHFNPKLLTLKARGDSDTTQVSLHSGDLSMILTGSAPLDQIMNQFTLVSESVTKQLEQDSAFRISETLPLLPEMSLSINAAKDNPIFDILRQYYLGFNDFRFYAQTSPESGFTMDMNIYAAYRDTFLLDTIRASIRPDSLGLFYSTEVVKYRYRQQLPFKASVNGHIQDAYIDANLLYKNHIDETGIQLGISAQKEKEGYLFKLFPEDPVIAFNKFSLNTDNYLLFKSEKDIDANIRLEGLQNASVWLHSVQSGDVYPEQHIELSQIDLSIITEGFPQLPSMKGILNADFTYAPNDESFMVVADANVDNLLYENGRVGELMFNAVYLPWEDKEHQFDVHFFRDRKEVITATALYQTGKQDNILGSLEVTELPLYMLNPFIPDGMAELSGALKGAMSIEGSPSDPKVNGSLQLDTASIYVGMLDSRFRFDSKSIEVVDNVINFNRYQLLTTDTNPFIINGTVNFKDLARMTTDLQMTADNMQVLDAKRTAESLVYGKLLMNFNTTIKGPVNQLVVRGDAHFLGGTDLAYVFTDSPLTAQDRMDGLVTFTSFTDTLTRGRRQRPQTQLSGIDMLMVLHIDPRVQFRVDLTPDQSEYVELEGGGDLSFQFTRQGDMVLNGRYLFSEGVVNYSLPVVPLKRFNIQSGSYVQWDGDVMNPLINLTATETMRATVDGDNGQRRVSFNVGISVQDRLDNMQLSFVIDAEDSDVKSDLNAMSEDERARQAVFLMVTGTYMASGGVGNLNLGGALGNYLVGEINNIAGDALKDVDIDIGLETYDGSGGQSQTDFTFSFAKRFYNDRIRLSIGGKVSTSGRIEEQQSFLDNFAAEYLLDAAGTKSIKLFYDKNYESILDGEVVETGVGIVFRKKVLKLGELFDFRKKQTKPVENENNTDDIKQTVVFINSSERRGNLNDEYENAEN